jgi:hypothetical protein
MINSRIYLKLLLIAVLIPLALTNFSALPAVFSSSAVVSGIEGGDSSAKRSPRSTKPGRAARDKVEDAFGKLPLRFELNKGRMDSRVRFISRGEGYSLLLTSDEAILRLVRATPSATSSRGRRGIRRPTSATLSPTRALIIDPILTYATYLGGASEESGRGIAVDPSGNAYVTGRTFSLTSMTSPRIILFILR